MKIVAKYSALLPAVQHATRLISESADGADGPSIVFDIDDTLIFDDNRQTPNVQIKHLLDVAKAHGCKVHLVTARQRSKDVRQWTRLELRRLGIQYDTLALAPEKARDSLAAVSVWKFQERKRHAPVLLSVGDQWGDLAPVKSDDDIDALDALVNVSATPWAIVQPEDGCTKYGLKLMAELR